MWHYTPWYVPGGNLCHPANHQRRKPMGLLQPLPSTKGHWRGFSINLISDVRNSDKRQDSIVTFVDHMTKRAHWRTCRRSINALASVGIFIDNIIRLHRVCPEGVLNHHLCFTADYGREVASIRQMKLLRPIAFHPGMDGLSEDSNKMVMLYLHGFATHNWANWDIYLTLVEYVYNSSVYSSMKQLPCELNLGYKLSLPLVIIAGLQQLQLINLRKPYMAVSFSNDCSIFWELPGMTYAMLRMNIWLRFLSHDTQSTPSSPPVRRYF